MIEVSTIKVTSCLTAVLAVTITHRCQFRRLCRLIRSKQSLRKKRWN